MTLAWTAVRVTETFVRPVPPAERDAYWADMATLGRLFGVSASGLPVDYQGMADHLEALVLTTLAVTPTSVELARRVLAPEPPVVVAPLRPAPRSWRRVCCPLPSARPTGWPGALANAPPGPRGAR